MEREVAVTVTDANEGPEFDVTSLTTDAGTGAVLFSVVENTSAVGTMTAADPDAAEAGATVTWGLSGTDAGLFDISSAGVITFKAAPDFEDPKGGADDDSNEYSITVEATAGTGGREATGGQEVTVTVTDDNDAPVFTSSADIDLPENTSAVVTVVAVDPDAADTVTYALTSADYNRFFTIDENSGALTVGPNRLRDFNFELGGAPFNVQVTATSGAGDRERTATQDLTVTSRT